MSTDAISIIRETEKLAETAEREAKEAAADIISKAHAEAKEIISSELAAAKAAAEAELAEAGKLNESFLNKAESEISAEVAGLRSQAEGKKNGVAKQVTEMLF